MREKISDRGRARLFCCFHEEKIPSLWVEPTGRFFCYGCHAQGDWKDHPTIEARYRVLQGDNPQQLKLPWALEDQVSEGDPRPNTASPLSKRVEKVPLEHLEGRRFENETRGL